MIYGVVPQIVLEVCARPCARVPCAGAVCCLRLQRAVPAPAALLAVYCAVFAAVHLVQSNVPQCMQPHLASSLLLLFHSILCCMALPLQVSNEEAAMAAVMAAQAAGCPIPTLGPVSPTGYAPGQPHPVLWATQPGEQ